MRTVKVRIAVAVDAKGAWGAYGWSSGDAAQMMEIAVENVEDGEARYWVEAELAVPEVSTVEGKAEAAA